MYESFLHDQITTSLVFLHMYAVDFGALLVSFLSFLHMRDSPALTWSLATCNTADPQGIPQLWHQRSSLATCSSCPTSRNMGDLPALASKIILPFKDISHNPVLSQSNSYSNSREVHCHIVNYPLHSHSLQLHHQLHYTPHLTIAVLSIFAWFSLMGCCCRELGEIMNS